MNVSLLSKYFYVPMLLGLLLSSCASKKDVVYFQNARDFETIVDTETFKPRLKIGDVLNINISTIDLNVTRPYNLIESTGGETGGQLIDYVIDPEGYIDYPVLGKIKLMGLTIEEAKELFKQKFEEGDLLKDPVIIIRIKNYKISVLGAVNNPGVYPVSGERVSLLEAIAAAGDLTIRGRRDNIMVIRDFNGAKTYTKIDLTKKEVFNSPVYYLTQNDIVYVEPNKAAINASAGEGRGLTIVSTLVSIVLSIVLITSR